MLLKHILSELIAENAALIKTHTKPLIVYHGTASKFKKFDLSKSTQRIIWFTSDKNKILSGEAGAQGRGYIIKAEVTINNPAGWNEYDKLSLEELQRDGYDGAILPDNKNEFDCFVFSTSQIKILEVSKIEDELKENEDYRGAHKAPDKENGAPLHKLDQIYPEDIYSNNAARYYGDQSSEYSDGETISIMQSVRNNPRAPVKIYRAIPKAITAQEKIYDLEQQKAYILKRGKVPPNANTSLNSSQYYEEIGKEIERLKALPEEPEVKTKINPGDWITINKKYAIVHGKSALGGNYRILSKTVPAGHLYTDANSIHEFGYDPS